MGNDSVGAGDVLLRFLDRAAEVGVARYAGPESTADQTPVPEVQGPAIPAQPENRNQYPAWAKPAAIVAGVLVVGFLAKKAGLV